jgi:hypothetical protein
MPFALQWQTPVSTFSCLQTYGSFLFQLLPHSSFLQTQCRRRSSIPILLPLLSTRKCTSNLKQSPVSPLSHTRAHPAILFIRQRHLHFTNRHSIPLLVSIKENPLRPFLLSRVTPVESHVSSSSCDRVSATTPQTHQRKPKEAVIISNSVVSLNTKKSSSSAL